LAAQYPSFNALKDAFDGQVDIIGVPCTQFFNQEPGSPEEIRNALKYVRPGGGFEPNFRLMEKSEINGENRIPLYKWALGLCDSPDPGFVDKAKLFYSPMDNSDIRWNYEKILFDTNGVPYRRYHPSTLPDDIIPDIEAVLAKKSP